jgi:L-iditol 2-dehydrogenase
LPTAIHLVASGAVELDSLVTGRYDLDHVADALNSDADPASLKSIMVCRTLDNLSNIGSN